jgi:hypothetical protein
MKLARQKWGGWWVYNLVGGFNPSEKYESQLEWLFPIYGKKTCSKPPTSNDIKLHDFFGYNKPYLGYHIYVYIYGI